ncbi:uncharacterized protein KY384_006888 [Bacidia gigantensis]|uniref:uncharacterized protein n=1 Tax=Bacidia gigantensis TaxID=2732470 RepID=UPI001D050BA3|nr:uncharacterized protein KY384_006888 [Bacidia gigantensis]KAG8527972.1 hypothetical protein KY384_006888 [Bacidia gigantensis]
MPRTPTPQPLEERDVDTLNPAELRELLNHYKEQANAQPTKAEQVKTERRRGIKRERDEELEAMLATSTSKRVNNRPFRDGEIVELD